MLLNAEYHLCLCLQVLSVDHRDRMLHSFFFTLPSDRPVDIHIHITKKISPECIREWIY